MPRIRFLQPQHFCGRTYAPGDSVEADDRQARALAAAGVAEVLKPDPPAPPLETASLAADASPEKAAVRRK
jgi:hypothetical protein